MVYTPSALGLGLPQSELAVGKTVKIQDWRTMVLPPDTDVGFGHVSGMERYIGEVTEIDANVGEGYWRLQMDGGTWNWHGATLMMYNPGVPTVPPKTTPWAAAATAEKTELAVGVRVRIAENLAEMARSVGGKNSIRSLMVQYAGKFATIVQASKFPHYWHLDVDNEMWCWHQALLTVATSAPAGDSHLCICDLETVLSAGCQCGGK